MSLFSFCNSAPVKITLPLIISSYQFIRLLHSSVYPSICLYLFIHFICLFTHSTVYQSMPIHIYLSTHLWIHLSIHPSILWLIHILHLFIKPSIHSPIYTNISLLFMDSFIYPSIHPFHDWSISSTYSSIHVSIHHSYLHFQR